MEPDLLAELGTCQHACAESPPINAGKPQHLNPAKLPGHPQKDSRDSTQDQAANTNLPPGCDHKASTAELPLQGTAGQDCARRIQDQQGSQ